MAETTTSWNTTIILSTALKNHTISRMLMAQQHRIRFSETVEKGALIFPLSGNAFLLVDLQNHLEPSEESELIKRIDIFSQVHRNSFLLFYLPFSGKRGLQILSDIQCRFFHTKVRILPVRNNNEVLNGMLTIAKATSKSHMDSICFRMSLAQAHIVESSGVWEFLKGTLSW
ncbi:protein SPO16 homolog [Cynoglossus semilaevis]|nr:uncharacterized protein C1orf146 homolog [Cynoglossus semilaevis]